MPAPARQCRALPWALPPLVPLVLALCVAPSLARPDCNACFMKNAAKDLAASTQPPHGHNAETATAASASPTAQALSEPLRARPKRTARAAWDHVDVQGRLRDALGAENAYNAPEQWWDDSAVDVDASSASARWPYRGRWREGHGQAQTQRQVQGQGTWGEVTDAMATATAQKVGQNFI